MPSDRVVIELQLGGELLEIVLAASEAAVQNIAAIGSAGGALHDVSPELRLALSKLESGGEVLVTFLASHRSE